MSSIAAFYVLPETKRSAFEAAYRTEPAITRKRSFFGTIKNPKKRQTLSEFLDADISGRFDFPYSGFAIIDYFFCFLILPAALSAEIDEGRVNDNCFAFGASLAERIGDYLARHKPESAVLTAYVAERGEDSPAEWIEVLFSAHDALLRWFQSVDDQCFGVLYLTF